MNIHRINLVVFLSLVSMGIYYSVKSSGNIPNISLSRTIAYKTAYRTRNLNLAQKEAEAFLKFRPRHRKGAILLNRIYLEQEDWKQSIEIGERVFGMLDSTRQKQKVALNLLNAYINLHENELNDDLQTLYIEKMEEHADWVDPGGEKLLADYKKKLAISDLN